MYQVPRPTVDSEEIIYSETEIEWEEEQTRLFNEIRKPIPTLEQIEEEIHLEEIIEEEEQLGETEEEPVAKLIFDKSESKLFESHSEILPISYDNVSLFEKDFEEFIPDDDVLKGKKQAEPTDLLFLTAEFKKVSGLLRQSTRKSSRASVNESRAIPSAILDPIINNVVNLAVKKMYKEEVNNKLNRTKLGEKLFHLQNDIIRAQFENRFLTKAATHYMKHKKNLRALSTEPKYNDSVMREKYLKNLNKLDDILGRMDQLKQDQKNELTKQKDNYETNYKTKLALMDDLETLIRETSYKCYNSNNGVPLSQEFVEGALLKLKRFNKEVSYFQNRVILIGHTVSVLKERVDSFTNIHSNIKLQQFESLQAEINLLQAKIEGSGKSSQIMESSLKQKKSVSADFNSLKEHFKNICHVLSHARERTQSVEVQFQLRLPELHEVTYRQRVVRKKLQFLKTKRDKLRQYYKTKNYKCGLVNKPLLLNDYDNLEIKIKKKTESVKKLKEEKDRLAHLIDKLNLKYFNTDGNITT